MRNIYSILLLCLVLVSSCTDDALFNSGDTITRTVQLADYSVIEVESTFEIELVSDTVNKVLVTCGENLYPFVKIATVDNVLYLKHEIKNNWSRQYEKVKLKLHTKPFSGINVRQPSKIFNRDIYVGSVFAIVDWGKYSELDMNVNVDFCQIAMSSDNFGHFKVKGQSRNSHIWGWGSSFVYADSLISENCSVLHRGIGNVYVNVTNQLDVALEFSGNVYYTSEPAHINIQHRLGTGNIYKK